VHFSSSLLAYNTIFSARIKEKDFVNTILRRKCFNIPLSLVPHSEKGKDMEGISEHSDEETKTPKRYEPENGEN
jgi:hypothetical protein